MDPALQSKNQATLSKRKISQFSAEIFMELIIKFEYIIIFYNNFIIINQ